MRNSVAAICALGSLSLCGCDSGLSVCEEHIKSQLRSPSTYKRLTLEKSVELRDLPTPPAPTSKNELMRQFQQNRLDEWKAKPKREIIRYRITSEAANAFGVPVRGDDICEISAAAVEKMNADPWGFWGTGGITRRSLLSDGAFRAAFRQDLEPRWQAGSGKAGQTGAIRPDCCGD